MSRKALLERARRKEKRATRLLEGVGGATDRDAAQQALNNADTMIDEVEAIYDEVQAMDDAGRTEAATLEGGTKTDAIDTRSFNVGRVVASVIEGAEVDGFEREAQQELGACAAEKLAV